MAIAYQRMRYTVLLWVKAAYIYRHVRYMNILGKLWHQFGHRKKNLHLVGNFDAAHRAMDVANVNKEESRSNAYFL